MPGQRVASSTICVELRQKQQRVWSLCIYILRNWNIVLYDEESKSCKRNILNSESFADRLRAGGRYFSSAWD